MIVRELRGKYKLSLLLDIAGISKQIYYYEIKHFDDKDEKDKFYEGLILQIFHKNYDKYGIPRITIALNKKLKEMHLSMVNHKKVERLMRKLKIHARPKQRKYISYKGNVGKTAPNILNRDFTTAAPYEKLGTDITVFIMPFGKVYLSPIIDFHTREILGYDLSEHPDYRQIARMFVDLVNKHGGKISNAILHSDQGWQYQMSKYREKLKELDIIQSMSRKGNCLDDSPTENFFGRMKEEMFYGKESRYTSMEKLKKEIHKYIRYYNNDRIVTKLKNSPINYRIENFGIM